MRILVCGGGIAGLTLAMCLERNGHRPIVVERSPTMRSEGYMIDFFGSGYDACAELGLLEELESIHHPIPRITFVDREGKERMALSYPELRRRIFDDHHFNFMRGELEAVLYRRVASRANIRFGRSVESLAQGKDYVSVRLSDGQVEEVDIVVGADGVHSRIRELAFGDDTRFVRYLGCHTAAFTLRDLAGFEKLDAFVTMSVPNRQVALYPIRGGSVATLFVHRAEKPLDDTSRASALNELRAVYGDLGGYVPALLERANESEIYFDDVSQIEMPSWSTGRVVLVGDSCQCMSLLAGQGASMAVAGALVLSEELARFRGGDITMAFHAYERRMKRAVLAKQAAGRRIASWFVPESEFRRWLRDLGLRMSVLPLASFVIRRRLEAESIFRN